MYLRTIGRRNKDGSEVRYVQLAHNEWDSARKCSIARVVHSFGREDQLDRDALARLGKFLLRSSDPTLSAEDIALGYKQLLQVERAWRDMKTTLDLRPVHHRKEDRIRAHVQLCWLALLLIRIAEHETADTWRNLRRELQRLHQGTFRGSAGEVTKTSEPTHKQQQILTTLGVPPPPAFPALAPAT